MGIIVELCQLRNITFIFPSLISLLSNVSYPKLVRVCRDKEVSVAELMKLDNGVLFWDVSFFKGVHARELEALAGFMDTIYGASVKEFGEDKMC